MFDSNNFVYFISTRTKGSAYGFNSYTDKDGHVQMIVNSYDRKTGDPIPRSFNFSKKDRVIRIPKNQLDKEGKSVVEFLRDSPECHGSPNNEGQPIMFKELNEANDAKKATQIKAVRIKAENIALDLEGDDLVELAASLGVVNSEPAILQHRMLELAHRDPETFMDAVNSPDKMYRSIINSGLKTGILSQRGTLIVWEDVTIGANMKLAIEKLASDKKLTDAIKDAVKRMK